MVGRPDGIGASEMLRDVAAEVVHPVAVALDKPAGEVPLLDDGLISFLSRIWNTYGIFDGKYLEQLTHKETPWIEARGDCKDGEPCTNVISKESMKSFFKKRINE